jgi:hypothetical protein
MTDYPTPPPIPQPAARPEPPPSITMAVRLMYAGAALSLISFVATLLTMGSMRDAVRQSAPNLPPAQVDAAVTLGIVFSVILGLIGAGLWVLMAVMNNKGAKWARIVGTIFFALNTIGLLTTIFSQNRTIVGLVFGVLIWLVGLGAVVFMWNKDSSAYYEAASARPA